MIPVLTGDEMKRADAATFERIRVPSRAVMEVAARAVVEIVTNEYPGPLSHGVLVVAGGGNNGGDGYCIARQLKNLGISVTVLAVRPLDQLKGDARGAAESWFASGGTTIRLPERGGAKDIDWNRGVIIDALFGTGFSGSPDPVSAEVISAMNSARRDRGAVIISVDVPSGLDASSGARGEPSVEPTATVALQCPKLGQVIVAPETSGNKGSEILFVADIGISVYEPEIQNVRRSFLAAEEVAALLRESYPLGPGAHKGTRGHVLALGGGRGHFGAPKLAALGALCAGAGLATAAMPAGGAREVEGVVLEVMCVGLPDDGSGEFSLAAANDLPPLLSNKDALVVGPGLSVHGGGLEVLRVALEAAKRGTIPTVIDAGALALIATHESLRSVIPAGAVLTPHPGELARLLHTDVASIQRDRLQAAFRTALEFRAVVVLKGARTVIATPDGEVCINPAATELLGTAGSGDVLAGVIGALSARGVSPFHAALLGVFLHGAAGELLEGEAVFGAPALTIAREIPSVMSRLLSERPRAAPRTFRRVLPVFPPVSGAFV